MVINSYLTVQSYAEFSIKTPIYHEKHDNLLSKISIARDTETAFSEINAWIIR